MSASEPGKPAYSNPEVRNAALLFALKTLGASAAIGGGTRLAQELYGALTSSPRKTQPRVIPVEFPDLEQAAEPEVKEAAGAAPMGSIWEYWPTYPLAALALLGGGLGGYKGVRSLTDKAKKNMAESDLEDAKKDFHDAMTEEYLSAKTAGAKLGLHLDEQFEKLALNWGEMIGGGKGLAATAAASVFLLSHLATLNKLKKSDPEALYQKILEKQRRLRQAQAPLPVEFRMKGNYPDESNIAAETEAAGSDPFVEDDGASTDALMDSIKTSAIKEAKKSPWSERKKSRKEEKEEEEEENTKAAGVIDTIKQAPSAAFNAGKNLATKGTAEKVVNAAGEAAQSPEGLKPVTSAISSDVGVKDGIATGIGEKLRSVPVLGQLLG